MNDVAALGKVIPFPNELKTRCVPLPGGDRGIAITIREMGKAALGPEGAANPYIRAAALDIVRGQPARDELAQAAAIYNWTKANIEFRGELDETVQTPLVTMQFRAGDCDDHATLIVALLRALGISGRFITVAGDPRTPRQFTHVFAEAIVRRPGQQPQAVALDSTVASANVGWRPLNVPREKAWPALGDTAVAPVDTTNAELKRKALDAVLTVAQGAAEGLRDRLRHTTSNPGGNVEVNANGKSYGVSGGVAGISTPWLVGGSVASAAMLFALLSKRR